MKLSNPNISVALELVYPQLLQKLVRQGVGVEAVAIDQYPLQLVFVRRYSIKHGLVGRVFVVIEPELLDYFELVVKDSKGSIPAFEAVLLEVEVFGVALVFQGFYCFGQCVIRFHDGFVFE
jgi:hypothetical protein